MKRLVPLQDCEAADIKAKIENFYRIEIPVTDEMFGAIFNYAVAAQDDGQPFGETDERLTGEQIMEKAGVPFHNPPLH